MRSEHRYYLFAGGCLSVAVALALNQQNIPIALVGIILTIGLGEMGRQAEEEVREKQEVIEELIDDKDDLRDDLNEYREQSKETKEQLQAVREKKEALKEKKKRENRRLSNLKRALQRKGIDTEYLIDKYGDSVYAPIMVLTHFSAPNNNTEDDEKFIKSNLEALDTKMLQGGTRIVPPRNFDQSIETREELESWFHENVLGGRDNLGYKLEALLIADITRVFDKDASKGEDESGFPANTVTELFETDTVVPDDDLFDILSRSDRISLEEELRENIALLAVHSASETQMEEIIEVQSTLEDELGELSQIAATKPTEIKSVLEDEGISDSEELAESMHQEANRLAEILDS